MDTVTYKSEPMAKVLYGQDAACMVDNSSVIFLKHINKIEVNMPNYGCGELIIGADRMDIEKFYDSSNIRIYRDNVAPMASYMGYKSKPTPKKVIFSGPATTILWKDGTKTTVKCSSEDVWDDDVGIAMCYLKKMLGNKGNFNNIFREAMKVAEVQYKKEDLNAAKKRRNRRR